MGQFKYGRNLKGKVLILIPRYFGISGPQCSHQLSPFLLSPYVCLFFHFSIFLSHSATKAHTHTPSSSLSFSHSLTSKPAIYHHFWRISPETPLETPYARFSQSFKGKTLNCLVAFQVFLRFLSNLSYMSCIHVTEYMSF